MATYAEVIAGDVCYRLPVDGATVTPVIPGNGKYFTLEELQGFVGGLIQFVETDRGILICNEEAKCFDGWAINKPATILAGPEFRQYDVIAGDAVYVPKARANFIR